MLSMHLPLRGPLETGAHRAPLVPGLGVHPPGDPARAEVEAFVRAVYRDHFGADVRAFAPTLVSLRDPLGTIVAAAGYRAAVDGPLFLERYLDAPIEARLAASGASRPERMRIVEVGHLAAGVPGEGRRLILMLGPHLAARGFRWVVGTLTEELRHLFMRLGIAPMALGIADPSVLGADAAGWGSYYDHRPIVLAGQIEEALARLARRRTLR